MATESRYKAEDYTVGWICALPVELAASVEVLDEEHTQRPPNVDDGIYYTFGSISGHNIVIGCLPAGQIGVTSAATVATQMKASFKSIRIGLMVGVGGGVPSDEQDIRLGDVVVSQPTGQYGGVVQYDLGKREAEGQFRRTGALNAPPQFLLIALAAVQAAGLRGKLDITKHLSKFIDHPIFAYPQAFQDKLFEPTYTHPGGPTCKKCSDIELVERDDRSSKSPVIHYGTIASGNQVMKDGVVRDQLSQALGGVLCFEMEAAGLMNNFPCLVIRGICDYSDSHKNKGWQPYAATTAAAFAKELLGYVTPASLEGAPTIDEAMKELAVEIAETRAIARSTEHKTLSAEEERILKWLSEFDFSQAQHEAHDSQMSGTGEWLLKHTDFLEWRDSSSCLLWLYGNAGCGKTIICSTIIDHIYQRCQHDPTKQLAYWFYQFSESATQNVSRMLRSFIRQLDSPPFTATRALWTRHKTAGSRPSVQELISTMDEILRGLRHQIFLVIDALDECPQTAEQPERKKLLQYIQHLLEQGFTNVHILVTSRPEPDIRVKLRHIATYTMNVDCHQYADVEMFIKHSVNTKLSIWNSKTPLILNKLLCVDERRFRWADLQIKRLQECVTLADLDHALDTIPETLEKTYKEALDRTPDSHKHHVRKILMWLTSSLRPMTLQEIAAVVAFQSPNDVLRVCTNLFVTIIEDDGNGYTGQVADSESCNNEIIKLAHFSVKEYLIPHYLEEKEFHEFQFSNELAHHTIATMTMDWLLNDNMAEPVSLLQYSAQFWPLHAKEVFRTSPAEFQNKVQLLFDTEHYMGWLSLYNHDQPGHMIQRTLLPQPLYVASLLGFEEIVEKLWKGNNQLKVRDGMYENAINAAAVKGFINIVKFFIQNGDVSRLINLSLIIGKAEGGIQNIEETLELLLELEDKVEITGEVMKAAARNEHNGATLMKLLLDRRADEVHITRDVVEAAAWNRNQGESVMKLLLDRRADEVHITDKVMQIVAWTGHQSESVMKLLLDRRADEVHITEEVVEAAAGNEHNGAALMKLLLDRRANEVYITEEVIEAAAGNERYGAELIKLLLDRRADDVLITSKVVEAAAWNRNQGESVMKLLLDRRADEVHITDEVVKAAAMNYVCGESVMELLLDWRWGDMQITEQLVATIAERFSDKVMKLLLDRRADEVHITDKVVEAAVMNVCGESVMELLLDWRGDDMQITEQLVATIAEGFSDKVMKLLLDRRADEVHITDKVVEAAVMNVCGESVMELLLDWRGDDMQITEQLVAIIAGGFSDKVMKLLLDRRADDVHITDKVMKAAAQNWHDAGSTMKLLLDRQEDQRVSTGSTVFKPLYATNYE